MQGSLFLQKDVEVLSESDSETEFDSRLVHLIEEAVLFGRVDELDVLLGWISEEDPFPKDLLRDIEVLRHFRAYYGRDTEHLSLEDKQLVLQWDSEWSMHLVKRMHQGILGHDGLSIKRPFKPSKPPASA